METPWERSKGLPWNWVGAQMPQWVMNWDSEGHDTLTQIDTHLNLYFVGTSNGTTMGALEGDSARSDNGGHATSTKGMLSDTSSGGTLEGASGGTTMGALKGASMELGWGSDATRGDELGHQRPGCSDTN
jgi:hypothetical protein